MAVFYKIVKNNNSKSPTNGKYYARAVHVGTISQDEIAERIQRNVSVKKSDVRAVITELVEVMTDILQNGQKVKLDEFGTFFVGLKSKPAENLKDFSAAKHIVGSRVNFQPEMRRGTGQSTFDRAFLKNLKVRNLDEGSTSDGEDGEEGGDGNG